MPRYFEDFEVGEEATTGSRTVTETDIVTFAGLSGDFNPLHMDAEFAKTTPYGGRIAHGLIGLSLVTGLIGRIGGLEGTGLAFLGITDWRFSGPIHIGDTVHVVITVEEKRGTSHPERGILLRRCRLINQRDEVIQHGVFATMVKRRTDA